MTALAVRTGRSRGTLLSMTRIAIAPVLLVSALLISPPAEATGSDSAASCSTRERGRSLVTTIQWLAGGTSHIGNMRPVDQFFPGVVEIIKPATRGGAIVTKCRVRADGTVVLRTTGGARIDIAQPIQPEVPHPAILASWTVPVSFHSTVSADWRAAEAVAAWNLAMPVGKQISLQAEECAPGDACVSITSAPNLAQPSWRGVSWPLAADGVMVSCSVQVADFVLPEDRPAVMAHEIGHCLGLPHWEYRGSVMQPHFGEGWTDLPSRFDLEWLAE